MKEVNAVDDFLLTTNSVTKKYGDVEVVSNVNIHVQQGHIYGLLGRNGAGKTTLMKMIMGLVQISRGEINVFGENIKTNGKKLYPRIGCIIETPGFYSNLTAAENLNVLATLRGTIRKDAVSHALNIVGLPVNDKKKFSQFSLGMKQRLGIANALLNDAELLILDEPTNGLDPIGIAEMRKLICELSAVHGKTVFISSHILNEISLIAEDIGIIHKGKLLVEKPLKELYNENGQYIQVKVSDVNKSAYVVENVIKALNYRIEPENILKIYEDIEPEFISRSLVENGVDVSELIAKNDSLEEYFKRITGGEGIA